MSKVSNEQFLSKIYYDLERDYGSAKSLYEQAKEEGTVITLEVKNFMKKRPNQLIKTYQHYSSYLPPYARAEFQTDTIDMNKLKQEEDRYDSIVLDAFSRYAYINPMKNKNSKDALKAKKKTFKIIGEAKKVYSDEELKSIQTD